jgi:hypothetical protein
MDGVDWLFDAGNKRFALRYDGQPAAETVTHWLADLILPQLMAHEGHFVLHCGAVNCPRGALGFIGPSGAGKSTLTASLHQRGLNLISDDAVVLSQDVQTLKAERLYPSLRLFPDSIDLMFPNIGSTAPVAEYTDKRHVTFAPGPASAPLIALFRLADPSDDIHISRLTFADACIALIGNSFALDPADPAEAKRRFAEASKVARQIAVYDLHYPRDYGVLPEVHELVFKTVGLDYPEPPPA